MNVEEGGPVNVEERVVHMIAQLSTVRQSAIRKEDRLREDLGLDSVSSMELISMLAEELDVEVALEEAMAVTTVGGAVELARGRMKGP
jgi:acyl carrier protein